METMKLPRTTDQYRVEKLDHHSDLELKKIIRAISLKVTDQRLAILRALCSGSHHVTAQQVFDMVTGQGYKMGFATVYRFLRTLTEHKFVTEVRMGSLPARYELAPTQHHDHLSCVQCGRIVEFENHAIEALQEKVAETHGFRLTGHVLELYGLCPSCIKSSEK